MINYNNHNITALTYNGHSIKYVYGCDGRLVYDATPTPPTPIIPPNWKERFEYTDGAQFYGGANFSTSGNVSYSADYASYVYTYDGTQYVYNYETQYKGMSAIQNNVSALTINAAIVDTISAYTFSGCSALTIASAETCCNIKTVGNYAFSNCKNLQETNILMGVTRIGDYAFQKCSNLREILFNYVEYIGNQAFYQCSSPSNWHLVIPNTIKEIGVQAFYGCSNLNTIIVQATTPPTLRTSAFNGCADDLKIYVPASAVEAYKADSGWSDYKNIIYPIT